MKTETGKKEEMLSLKQVRLQHLQEAAYCIARHDENQGFEYLKNFIATVENDSDAAKRINEASSEMVIFIKQKYEVLSKHVDSPDMGILEQSDIWIGGRSLVRKEALRNFSNDCWDIALDFELIPKE